MIPCFPLSSLGFPTFCFLKAESMKVLSCFHAFYFPSFQPSSFISILTSEQTNQLNGTTYIILRTILGQCFHAFHFPAFQPSSIISILTFEQTNQFQKAWKRKAGKHCPKMVLNNTVYIKDHFRAVLSCFPLSSFPTLLLYHNPDVRADEPVVSKIWLQLSLFILILTFEQMNLLYGKICIPTLILYLNPDVRADEPVVYTCIQYILRTNTIASAILPVCSLLGRRSWCRRDPSQYG